MGQGKQPASNEVLLQIHRGPMTVQPMMLQGWLVTLPTDFSEEDLNDNNPHTLEVLAGELVVQDHP